MEAPHEPRVAAPPHSLHFPAPPPVDPNPSFSYLVTLSKSSSPILPDLTAFHSCPQYSVSSDTALPPHPPLFSKVRHICTNLCFYKAYAPNRAWCSLNAAIARHGFEPNLILAEWTCQLRPQPTSKNLYAPNFIAPSGDIFTNVSSVLSSLHIPNDISAPPSPQTLITADTYQSPSYCDLSSTRPNKKIKSITSPPPPSPPTPQYSSTLYPSPYFLHPTLPISPLGLLEELATTPWQLLVICMLLNRTTRLQVDTIYPTFHKLYPTPTALLAGDITTLENAVKPCGMWGRRAAALKEFTREYEEYTKKGGDGGNLTDEQVTAFPAVGKYGLDGYRLFVRMEDVDVIESGDKALIMYIEWRRGAKLLLKSQH